MLDVRNELEPLLNSLRELTDYAQSFLTNAKDTSKPLATGAHLLFGTYLRNALDHRAVEQGRLYQAPSPYREGWLHACELTGNKRGEEELLKRCNKSGYNTPARVGPKTGFTMSYKDMLDNVAINDYDTILDPYSERGLWHPSELANGPVGWAFTVLDQQLFYYHAAISHVQRLAFVKSTTDRTEATKETEP